MFSHVLIRAELEARPIINYGDGSGQPSNGEFEPLFLSKKYEWKTILALEFLSKSTLGFHTFSLILTKAELDAWPIWDDVIIDAYELRSFIWAVFLKGNNAKLVSIITFRNRRIFSFCFRYRAQNYMLYIISTSNCASACKNCEILAMRELGAAAPHRTTTSLSP